MAQRQSMVHFLHICTCALYTLGSSWLWRIIHAIGYTIGCTRKELENPTAANVYCQSFWVKLIRWSLDHPHKSNTREQKAALQNQMLRSYDLTQSHCELPTLLFELEWDVSLCQRHTVVFAAYPTWDINLFFFFLLEVLWFLMFSILGKFATWFPSILSTFQ